MECNLDKKRKQIDDYDNKISDMEARYKTDIQLKSEYIAKLDKTCKNKIDLVEMSHSLIVNEMAGEINKLKKAIEENENDRKNADIL